MAGKKPSLLLALAAKAPPKGKGDMGDDEAAEGEAAPPSDLQTAAQEVLDAMQAKDASALADALRGFVSMCMSEESAEKPEPY